MPTFRPFTPDDAVTAARAALARAAGEPVSIAEIRDLGGEKRRNIVLRASAVWPDGSIRPVIVKATRASGYDPAASDAFETSGLVKEWAATALLARSAKAPAAPQSLGPSGWSALLAADTSHGVLVFEDFGEALPTLIHPLLRGSAAEAEAALTAYAVALAQLHAATIGCRDAHNALVGSHFPATAVPPLAHNWIDRVPRKVEAMLGGTLPETEIAMIAGRLQSPGPWLALAHRDPCPDNVLIAADGTAKLLDFEFSSPGHALLDAMYWRIGFPTCWCAGTVPAPVADRIDRAYRAIVAETVPVAADDDAYRRESAVVCAAWLLGNLVWYLEDALREDTKWGISTYRSRVLHYCEAAIATARDADVLPGFRTTTSRWLGELHSKWPDTPSLAAYPAFAETPDMTAPATS